MISTSLPEHSFMLKSYGVGARVYGVGARVYGVGARVYGSLVILVSNLAPNPSFFLFGGILQNRGLNLDLDQGLTIREGFGLE